jgi:hypothetical protein
MKDKDEIWIDFIINNKSKKIIENTDKVILHELINQKGFENIDKIVDQVKDSDLIVEVLHSHYNEKPNYHDKVSFTKDIIMKISDEKIKTSFIKKIMIDEPALISKSEYRNIISIEIIKDICLENYRVLKYLFEKDYETVVIECNDVNLLIEIWNHKFRQNKYIQTEILSQLYKIKNQDILIKALVFICQNFKDDKTSLKSFLTSIDKMAQDDQSDISKKIRDQVIVGLLEADHTLLSFLQTPLLIGSKFSHTGVFSRFFSPYKLTLEDLLIICKNNPKAIDEDILEVETFKACLIKCTDKIRLIEVGKGKNNQNMLLLDTIEDKVMAKAAIKEIIQTSESPIDVVAFIQTSQLQVFDRENSLEALVECVYDSIRTSRSLIPTLILLNKIQKEIKDDMICLDVMKDAFIEQPSLFGGFKTSNIDGKTNDLLWKNEYGSKEALLAEVYEENPEILNEDFLNKSEFLTLIQECRNEDCLKKIILQRFQRGELRSSEDLKKTLALLNEVRDRSVVSAILEEFILEGVLGGSFIDEVLNGNFLQSNYSKQITWKGELDVFKIIKDDAILIQSFGSFISKNLFLVKNTKLMNFCMSIDGFKETYQGKDNIIEKYNIEIKKSSSDDSDNEQKIIIAKDEIIEWVNETTQAVISNAQEFNPNHDYIDEIIGIDENVEKEKKKKKELADETFIKNLLNKKNEIILKVCIEDALKDTTLRLGLEEKSVEEIRDLIGFVLSKLAKQDEIIKNYDSFAWVLKQYIIQNNVFNDKSLIEVITKQMIEIKAEAHKITNIIIEIDGINKKIKIESNDYIKGIRNHFNQHKTYAKNWTWVDSAKGATIESQLTKDDKIDIIERGESYIKVICQIKSCPPTRFNTKEIISEKEKYLTQRKSIIANNELCDVNNKKISELQNNLTVLNQQSDFYEKLIVKEDLS